MRWGGGGVSIRYWWAQSSIAGVYLGTGGMSGATHTSDTMKYEPDRAHAWQRQYCSKIRVTTSPTATVAGVVITSRHHPPRCHDLLSISSCPVVGLILHSLNVVSLARAYPPNKSTPSHHLSHSNRTCSYNGLTTLLDIARKATLRVSLHPYW